MLFDEFIDHSLDKESQSKFSLVKNSFVIKKEEYKMKEDEDFKIHKSLREVNPDITNWNDFLPGDILLFHSSSAKEKIFIGKYGHAAMVSGWDIVQEDHDDDTGNLIEKYYVSNRILIQHCVYPVCRNSNVYTSDTVYTKFIYPNNKTETYNAGNPVNVKRMRLKTNKFASENEIANYRYYVSILIGFILQNRVNFGGIKCLLSKKCFYDKKSYDEINDDIPVMKKLKMLWEVFLNSETFDKELICSALVVLMYQLILFMFNPSMLVSCLNVNARKCRPDHIYKLLAEAGECWEEKDNCTLYYT